MTLHRRSLVGSLLAMPFIIRSPGLLMPISTPRLPTPRILLGVSQDYGEVRVFQTVLRGEPPQGEYELWQWNAALAGYTRTWHGDAYPDSWNRAP